MSRRFPTRKPALDALIDAAELDLAREPVGDGEVPLDQVRGLIPLRRSYIERAGEQDTGEENSRLHRLPPVIYGSLISRNVLGTKGLP